MKNVLTRITLVACLATAPVGAALADTYAIVSNVSGHTIQVDGSSLGNNKSKWTPLHADIRMGKHKHVKIKDTGKKCGKRSWTISAEGKNKSTICLHIPFLITGCVGVFVENDTVELREMKTSACSNKWWAESKGDAFSFVKLGVKAGAAVAKAKW